MTGERRKVLITGAGSGLGRALAQRYANEGCAVACADLVPARAVETAATLPGMGHQAFVVDVGSDSGYNALYMAVEQHFGMPEVVVNNAGIASGGPMANTTMSEWHDVVDINLLGVVRGCRAFLPAMLANGRGHILNIASFAGLAGAPGIMSYGVAKAGVVALSEQLRAELQGTGVSVSVACPSFFQTRLLDNFLGSQIVKESAATMMERSRDSLDAIADRIFAASARGQFMILPSAGDAARWRMKRWFPERYFKQMLKATAALRQPARIEPSAAPAEQPQADTPHKQVE